MVARAVTRRGPKDDVVVGVAADEGEVKLLFDDICLAISAKQAVELARYLSAAVEDVLSWLEKQHPRSPEDP